MIHPRDSQLKAAGTIQTKRNLAHYAQIKHRRRTPNKSILLIMDVFGFGMWSLQNATLWAEGKWRVEVKVGLLVLARFVDVSNNKPYYYCYIFYPAVGGPTESDLKINYRTRTSSVKFWELGTVSGLESLLASPLGLGLWLFAIV